MTVQPLQESEYLDLNGQKVLPVDRLKELMAEIKTQSVNNSGFDFAERTWSYITVLLAPIQPPQ